MHQNWLKLSYIYFCFILINRIPTGWLGTRVYNHGAEGERERGEWHCGQPVQDRREGT